MFGSSIVIRYLGRGTLATALRTAAAMVVPVPRRSRSYEGAYRRAWIRVFPDGEVVLVRYVRTMGDVVRGWTMGYSGTIPWAWLRVQGGVKYSR